MDWQHIIKMSKTPTKPKRRNAILIHPSDGLQTQRRGPAKSVLKIASLDDSLRQAPMPTRSNTDEDSSACIVQFKSTIVYYHNNILGDNPSALAGPPLTLSWNHFDVEESSVDVFESSRPECQRYRSELIVSPFEREMRLKSAGYTSGQILFAMKEIRKAKMQRQKSNHQSGGAGAILRSSRQFIRKSTINKSFSVSKDLDKDEKLVDDLWLPTDNVRKITPMAVFQPKSARAA